MQYPEALHFKYWKHFKNVKDYSLLRINIAKTVKNGMGIDKSES